LETLRDRISGHDDAPETLGDEIDAIGEELDEINEELGDIRRGAGARSGIERVHSAPTADALFRIERGWDALPAAIERLNTLITSRVPALHDMVSEAGLRPEVGDPIEVPIPPGR